MKTPLAASTAVNSIVFSSRFAGLRSRYAWGHYRLRDTWCSVCLVTCRHSVLQPAMFLPHGSLPPAHLFALLSSCPTPLPPHVFAIRTTNTKWNESHSSASRPRCDDQTHPRERGTSHGSGLARVPLSAGETTGAAAAQPVVPMRLSAAVAKEEDAPATVAAVAAVVAATSRCRSPRAAVGAL